MTKTLKKTAAVGMTLVLALGMTACGEGGNGNHNQNTQTGMGEELTATSMILQGDYGEMVDPPLLKKIAMYNAGCINPLSNYDRDMDYIQPLHADSLRIDLSIGKQDGTGGQHLVTGTPDNLQYDFSQLDSIVDQINAQNVLPYMSWGYVPDPLQYEGMFTNLDENIPNWQQVWEEIYYNYAKHFKDAGVKIGYHEVYNEPDLEYLREWGIFDESFVGFLDLDDFKNGVFNDMYRYGTAGILRADPDATIGGPAFAMGEIVTWQGFLNMVANEQLPLDFYSFHSYLDGDTWPSEKDTVVGALAANRYFNKTALHINEYTWINNDNGLLDGMLSVMNYAEGGPRTLDAAMIALNDTDVTMVHWAQYMESTFNNEPYGLVNEQGIRKPAYWALAMLADMPVWRYAVKTNVADNGLNYVTSADEDKISFLVWNTSGEDKTFTYQIKDAPFDSGKLTMYRVDENHASYYDGTETDALSISLEKQVSGMTGTATGYRGEIPDNGIVYITIHRTDDEQDFVTESRNFANDVKTQYWFGDRYDYISGSYSFFDRHSWTVYMGMGNNAVAEQSTALTLEDLPNTFGIRIQSEGTLSDASSARLGIRLDFRTESGEYAGSVFYHNGTFDDEAQQSWIDWNNAYTQPPQIIAFEGDTVRVDLNAVAPEGFDGRVMMSFYMTNTGANTRSQFTFVD